MGKKSFKLFKLLLIVNCALENDFAVTACYYIPGNILGCIKAEYPAMGIRSEWHSEFFTFCKSFNLLYPY